MAECDTKGGCGAIEAGIAPTEVFEVVVLQVQYSKCSTTLWHFL